MTKLIAIALTAFVVTAGAASAENTFALDRERSTASSLAVSNVQADVAGSVEVFAYDDGAIGDFLGGTAIGAGETASVDVALNQPTTGQLLVVLMTSNHSVAKVVTDAPLTN